jgi:hypothetical protein
MILLLLLQRSVLIETQLSLALHFQVSFSFTLNIHGNRNNIKTSCCSMLRSFVLFKTSVFHSTDPGKRLCIFRPSAPSPWPHFVSPPSPMNIEPESKKPLTLIDVDDGPNDVAPTPLHPPAPGDVDETTGGLLCGNSPFEIRDSRQVPNCMPLSPDSIFFPASHLPC